MGLNMVTLLLPALIPSWRFFDRIAPSPRIEFALRTEGHDMPDDWQVFRERPAHIPFSTMLKRLFWNPHWNETLYLMSCAERLMQQQAEHSMQQIASRIMAEIQRNRRGANAMQFRLVFVSRSDAGLIRTIAYVSPLFAVTEKAAA